MWQAIVVGLIVLAAAAYAFWALLPPMLRLRLSRAGAEWCRRRGGPGWLLNSTAALERAAARRVGGCGDCSAVQAAPKAPARRTGS